MRNQKALTIIVQKGKQIRKAYRRIIRARDLPLRRGLNLQPHALLRETPMMASGRRRVHSRKWKKRFILSIFSFSTVWRNGANRIRWQNAEHFRLKKLVFSDSVSGRFFTKNDSKGRDSSPWMQGNVREHTENVMIQRQQGQVFPNTSRGLATLPPIGRNRSKRWF